MVTALKKICVTLLFLLVGCGGPQKGPVRGGPGDGGVAPAARRTQAEIWKIVRDRLVYDWQVSVIFSDRPLAEAAAEVAQKIEHKILVAADADRKVSLELRTVPGLAAVYFLADSAGLAFRITRDEEIEFVPRGSLTPNERALFDGTLDAMNADALPSNRLVFEKLTGAFVPFVVHGGDFNEAIRQLRKDTGLNVVLAGDFRAGTRKIWIHALDVKADYALYWLGHPYDVSFEIVGHSILFVDRPSRLTRRGMASFDALKREMHPTNMDNPYCAEFAEKMKSRPEGLDFTGKTFEEALVYLADRFRLNVVLSPAIVADGMLAEKVNFRPGRMELEKVIHMLLGTRGLGFITAGGFIFIGKTE